MANEAPARVASLAQYHLLGRSGLRVSPLCLGTMTFGRQWGWGSDEETSRRIFQRYLEAGGNFVDTADGYTDGASETLVGSFLKATGHRDRVVLATKYTFNASPGDPNAGGNGRKNLLRALEGSLRRLQTDYVDLYWLHAWDTLTPAEEVMATMDTVVRQGKVRHVGLSDVPGWYLARAQTIAQWRGFEPVCALQLEYSLVERTIEREHVPAAQHLGMGICPWSPLAGGFLSGKYTREGAGEGRLAAMRGSGNPVFEKFTERNWRILDALRDVATALGRTPAQVALAWATRRPGVASTILGATTLAQLEDNLTALDLAIPPEHGKRLDEVSALERAHPYVFFGPEIQSRIQGGVPVRAEPLWFR
jgi:aryl-alcohol dehydrogenase-like predicted oxidoreductase